MAYEVVKTEIKYKGHIFDVKVDEITLPNGRTTMREIALRGPAAAIVPIDEDGNVILVRQYRHGPGEMVLEIPAGMLDEGETPLDCAVRELEEETGRIAGKMEKLLEYYVSVGFCTEVLTVYLATELSPGKQNLDADEFMDIEKLTFDEMVTEIMSGKINDAKTICGILAAKEHMRK